MICADFANANVKLVSTPLASGGGHSNGGGELGANHLKHHKKANEIKAKPSPSLAKRKNNESGLSEYSYSHSYSYREDFYFLE